MDSAKMVQSLRKYLKMLARYFLCLFYFNNMKEFQKQQQNLKLAKKRLKTDMEGAKARNPEIKNYAEPWLREVTKVLKEVPPLEKKIEDNEKSLTSRFDWSKRCELSDDIEALKQKIVDVIHDNRYNEALFRVNTPWDSLRNFMPSESFKSAFFEVVKAIKEESDPIVIAVHGQRGVGKTILAKLVEEKAEQLLNIKVKRIVVSESTNAEKIQEALAEFLELVNFPRRNERQRTGDLRRKLENKQRMLIIFDDFCKKFDLTSIGIPHHVSCKILVTASTKDAFSSLTNPRVIKLGGLEKEEAEKVLQEYSGQEITTVQEADQIAKECKYWPVAVTILGTALREKDRDKWSQAYHSLRSESALDVSKDIRIVYGSVKFSYDNLEHKETKICFLLCSLFPKDHAIARQDLKSFTRGLETYDGSGTDSTENVGKKVDAAIKDLIDSFLLLEDGNDHIRMPNVIREAALWIASKDESFPRIKSQVGLWEKPDNNDLESYTAISHVACKGQEVHDVEFQSGRLKILFLGGNHRTLNTSFSDGLKELKVLAIHHGDLSLNAFQNLTNLRALHLEYCTLRGLLASIEGLKNLEILSFQGSEFSESELDLDKIGELDNLRVLNLFNCQKLQPTLNSIWKLSQLEELYFSGLTFEHWWSSQDRTDLRYATPPRIISPSSLETKSFTYQKADDDEYFEATSRALKVTVFFKIRHSEKWDRTVKYLHRDRLFCYLDNVEPNLVQSVKRVRIKSCKTLQAIFQDGSILHAAREEDSLALLSDLTSLELENLKELRWIWYGNLSQSSVQNLKIVKLNDCQKLQSLFSVSLARSMNQLETLEIDSCSKLKQIISHSTNDVAIDVNFDETIHPGLLNSQCLPRLTSLRITGCPALEYIFQVTTGQILTKLTELYISSCSDLKQVFSCINHAVNGIELPLLQKLTLNYLRKLKAFCSENCPIKLSSLQHLEVRECHQLSNSAMSEVTRHGQLKGLGLYKVKKQLCGNIFEFQSGRFLSHLEELKLEDLNELDVIWKDPNQIFTLQNLTRLEVVRCNKLRYICSLLIARNLLQLSHLVVEGCEDLEKIIVQDQISSPSSSSSSMSRLKPIYFPNLVELLIEDCKNLKSLFPISVARLPKLRTFRVTRAKILKDIFKRESEATIKSDKDTECEAKVKRQKEVILYFQSLEVLQLEELPSLISFIPVNHLCEFPKLKSLVRKGCCLLVTRFYHIDSNPPIVYAKTEKSTVLERDQNNKFERSFTFQNIPEHNGDIDWSPQMELD